MDEIIGTWSENDNRYYLIHHGIAGQRWGVRKAPWYPIDDYQTHLKNRAAKRIQTNAPTKRDVDDIIRTLTPKEKVLLGMNSNDKEYLSLEESEHIIHRELKKVGDIPVAFFDMLDDGKTINLALATRNGDRYRGNGYATDAAAQAMDWLNKHPKEREGRDVVWGVRVDNKASIAVAKKLGFKEDPDSLSDDGKWINYVNSVKKSVFISGSSKTQDKNSGFYRKELPPEVKKEIDKMIKSGDRINVGDAPGIDRQVQDYLKKKNYDNVQVYGPGKEVRYTANKKWKTNPIDAPEFEPMSPGWLAKKDIQMEKDSDSGLAITIKGGASATRNNIDRLTKNGKSVLVYELDDANESLDRWLNNDEIMNIKLK